MSAPSCVPFFSLFFFFFEKHFIQTQKQLTDFNVCVQMTEKQGNTKQSNLNYIHTVINIKKKKKHVKNKVKKKQEIENTSNF